MRRSKLSPAAALISLGALAAILSVVLVRGGRQSVAGQQPPITDRVVGGTAHHESTSRPVRVASGVASHGVRIRVIDGDREPVSGARLSSCSGVRFPRTDEQSSSYGATGEDGWLTISSLSRGGYVQVRREGFVARRETNDVLIERSPYTIMLRRAHDLAMKVVDLHGDPVPGVGLLVSMTSLQVDLPDHDWSPSPHAPITVYEATTGDSGSVVIPGLAAGRYGYSVRNPELTPLFSECPDEIWVPRDRSVEVVVGQVYAAAIRFSGDRLIIKDIVARVASRTTRVTVKPIAAAIRARHADEALCVFAFCPPVDLQRRGLPYRGTVYAYGATHGWFTQEVGFQPLESVVVQDIEVPEGEQPATGIVTLDARGVGDHTPPLVLVPAGPPSGVRDMMVRFPVESGTPIEAPGGSYRLTSPQPLVGRAISQPESVTVVPGESRQATVTFTEQLTPVLVVVSADGANLKSYNLVLLGSDATAIESLWPEDTRGHVLWLRQHDGHRLVINAPGFREERVYVPSLVSEPVDGALREIKIALRPEVR